MPPLVDAVLGSWSLGFWPGLGLLLTAVVYLRGWRVLHRVTPERFPEWRAGAFLAGLGALILAVASPLDGLSAFLLSAHMVQHLLLMSVAAPLLLLGSPMLPLIRGLPRTIAHDGLGPFLTSPALKRFGHRLTHPGVCWIVFIAGLCAWHVPAAFELALRSPAWHEVEHATFFLGALLFWWPVLRPYPSRPVWPLWTVPVYLLAADIVNSALCAILSFSEQVIYPAYAAAPRLFGTSALSDQASAGVIMWVPGSIAFLLPAALVAIQSLSTGTPLVRPARVRTGTPVPAPSVPARTGPFDLLAVPRWGALLRHAAFRRAAQAGLLGLAAVVIADGFLGPRDATRNLAGILPWNVGRAIAVIGLLAVGNLFCFACPFMLPRELGRRLGLSQRAWPEWLRNKWTAIALLALFFWGYEAFDLWNRPAATAALVLAYFVAATLVDAVFRGASFCKYVCPIGQFNFVTSLVSPAEVQVRSPEVCAGCRTHDCLRGNTRQRGCELELFLPRKVGNLDCTFCLDCVRACPHDNIGIRLGTPGSGLALDPVRTSLGRLSKRPDLALLVLVWVAGAFAGAAAMTLPVSEWLAAGDGDRRLRVTFAAIGSLLVVPLAGLLGAVWTGRIWSGTPATSSSLACRLALALVPLGASLWAAHLVFHFLGASVPLFSAAVDAAFRAGLVTGPRLAIPSGFPELRPETILSMQTLLLGIGLLFSLHTGWRIARDTTTGSRNAFRLVAPWAAGVALLYAFGVWCLLQPMPLRGLVAIPQGP